MRRAVHKKTNVLRAVKIIFKDYSDKEDQERLINEVNILRDLVDKKMKRFLILNRIIRIL